jgi:dynein light intermediate chain 1, cytosolic
MSLSCYALLVDLNQYLPNKQDRQAYGQTPEPLASMDEEPEVEEAQPPVDTDTLAKFFGNLMNRKPTGAGNGGKI